MRDAFLCALNHAIPNKPKLCWDIASTFATQEEFLANQRTFFSSQRTTKDVQDKLRASLESYDHDNTLKKLADANITILTYDHPNYPTLLKECPTPPIVLYAQGNLDLLNYPALAVVGSRKMTQYGEQCAQTIVQALVSELVIVSGMAEGIDGTAHETALKHNGHTIAIVGTGLDSIYPSHHTELAKTIASKGLLLSEYPLGTRPHPQNFPQRNRIISGLSAGVLVIEAKPKSGSLITARLAMEQNRDIFAIPGSLFSENSVGPHLLIQDGAKLVLSHQDILNELRLDATAELPFSEENSPSHALTDEEAKVLNLIKTTPLTMDNLMAQSGMPPHQLMQILSFLEVQSLIRQSGGLYQHG